MTIETGTRDVLRIMELLLTAEIFNRNEELGINDLHPRCRGFFGAGSGGSTEVKRPLIVSEGAIRKVLGSPDVVCQAVRQNPFVGYDEFGQRLSLPSLDAGAGSQGLGKTPSLHTFLKERTASPPVTRTSGRRTPGSRILKSTWRRRSPVSSGRARRCGRPAT